jgi:flavin-dependent dehydrogenase
MTNPFTSEGISQAMRSGIFAADALGDVHDGVKSEAEALAHYETTCARTFLPSFWASAAFLAAARTPVLDVVVKATQTSFLKNTIGKALSHL